MNAATRVPNYAGLVEWAFALHGEPYRWGETDCASIVRRGLRVCYGRELWPGVPEWTSRREAVAVAVRTRGMVEALTGAGAHRIGLRFARTGDVVVGSTDGDGGLPQSALIIASGRALVSKPDTGVRIVPAWRLDPESSAWRIEA